MNYSLTVSELIDEIIKTLSVNISLQPTDTNYDLKVLLVQIKRVYRKIFTQYVDLHRTGKIEFSEGKVSLDTVAETLLGEGAKLLSVEKVEKNRRKLPFEVKDGYLYCEKAEEAADVSAIVLYDKSFAYTDSVPLPNAAFASVMVDGVASEYAAVRGLPQEAAYYKSCFESGIFNLTRDKKSRSIPARRFV